MKQGHAKSAPRDTVGPQASSTIEHLAAQACAEARVARWHLETTVISHVEGRDQVSVRALVETIYRRGILQDSVLTEIDELIEAIRPTIKAGTIEEWVSFGEPDEFSETSCLQTRMTADAEDLDAARRSLETLRARLGEVLDLVWAEQAVALARRAAERRQAELLQRPAGTGLKT